MSTATPEPTDAPLASPSPVSTVGAAGSLTHVLGLLRFSTAGSVDDGKSTLIGRLLYDSKSVFEDQLASVQKSKINRSGGPIDFSLLTDGLRAEREQGITIDVAYRYFSTPRRKFIIADTPGHEQYTRNMATGASTAEAAVVLMDATKGVLRQSRRHAYIAHLLGVQHIVAAVNKMDLVGFSQEVFDRISAEFREFADHLGIRNVYAVPVSALEGDNVVRPSKRLPWFEGPPLLEYLEAIPAAVGSASGPLRFPVQYVIRPDASFRGFAGQLVSGELRPGASVMALPSGVKTKVQSIVAFE
ncbi:MAG: GTP-binding protein, partial [Candidatus Acidiferrales bacterium]